jgi:hypothetical protein
MFHQITQVLEMSHAGKNYMFDSPEASLSFDRSYVGSRVGRRSHLLALNHYKGSGGNEKLLLRRFPAVGIVQKIPSTINKTQQQTSPQW